MNTKVTCETCGARGDQGFFTIGPPLKTYCPECLPEALAELNREPPDPDGEDFRGGEAAAYEREQMSEAQKLK